ncbi:GNAT family N-acetyltransferase [Candidatus Woesearchaeota archaeon]|nr:GNAT family N-acetyltransferase [Candidatus Woesearchaeota archaeon]
MRIRKAKKEDIPEIKKLVIKLFSTWAKIDPADKLDRSWFKKSKSNKFYNSLLKNKDKLLLVAEEDKTLIGYLLLETQFRDPFLEGNRIGYVSELFVLPEYRKKGISKELLKKSNEWFKKKKFKWLVVSTHSRDKPAIQFWKRKGFKEFNKYFNKRNL